MIVAAPTVEHSGTHFLIDLFRGFLHRHPTGNVAPGVNTLVQCHFGQAKHWGAFERIMVDFEPPLVIPVRRLHAIVLSWESRQKRLTALDRELSLMTDMVERQPYWLPIDAPDREDWLAEINDGLGLNLHTEWPVVGSEKKTNGKPEDLIQDRNAYENLKAKHGWFFEQIYG